MINFIWVKFFKQNSTVFIQVSLKIFFSDCGIKQTSNNLILLLMPFVLAASKNAVHLLHCSEKCLKTSRFTKGIR